MIEKFEGCLLGLAVGDALGGPLEFLTRDQIGIRHATVTEMIGGGWLDLRPGETTDDTAMALALAESLVAKKGFDPADVMQHYLRWYRTGPKDIGNTIRAALRHIDDGGDWKEAAVRASEIVRGETAGNGAMMRCAPLALLRHRDLDALVRDCAAEARLTHFDPRAGAGSAALGVAIALAFQETDRKKLLDRAFEALENNADGVANLLPDVSAKREGELRPEGFVVDSLEVALWHFLRAKNFEECLIKIVNTGGDADTIGAIAGALGGAYWGVGAIPTRWLRTIQERTTIKALARDILALATG